jgi:hypothetical protein
VDLISTLPVGSLGAGSILAIFVLLIMRGGLIPRQTHEDRMRDKDAQIEYWRTAHGREVNRGDELASQVTTLMEVASTAEHVLTSLSQVARKDEMRHETASSA